MYNTLYDVIKEMIRGNQLFKMHVSKWFAYVLQDVIDGQLIPDHPDGCYLALMKELLQENSFFLQNFVSTRLVSYISDCFDLAHHKEFTEIKYLQIFRVFCINTDEKVYTCNQTIVL